MADLTFRLLGSPQILRGGAPVQIGTRKAVALMICLVVTRERHQRDSLATLLWPEFDQQKARASLRNALSVLKRGLGAEWFDVDRQAVGLKWEEGISADIHHFRSLIADPTTDNLQTAINLYRDDFLTGFTLRDCPAFDEWHYFEMEQLRQSVASALEQLVAQLQTAAAWEEAIPHARRWVQLDPLHEPAQFQLITLYQQAGQHAAAMRQLEICVALFDEELGVSPGDELLALKDVIRKTRGSAARPETKRASVHHVPTYATSFIGRNHELDTIADNLTNQLVTLTGMGGIGKTRFAIQAVTRLTETFPDGIYYIDLVPLRSTHQIVPTLMSALAMPLRGADAPHVQLAAYLRDKQLLLVIDNFEHLIDGAETISHLCRNAPSLRVLITSRETLNIGEEWVYPLRGLPVPDGSAPAATFSSVQLFVARARQLQPGFSLADQEESVVKICQLVEGLPLGLELAAAWVRLLPCEQIAKEIAANADFLMTMQRDRPDRHRSLRVVFEHSWEKLSAEEQQALAQLSIFRGGATLEAARTVTQASLFALHGLVNRSLLRLEENGRYTLHELIRQFAYEKLERNHSLLSDTLANHGKFYINLLHTNETSTEAINLEIDNVRQSWQWAGDQQEAEWISRGLQGIYFYHGSLSRYEEGTKLIEPAITAIMQLASKGENHNQLLGRLLTCQGDLFASCSDLDAAQVVLQRAIVFLEPYGASSELSSCYRLIGLGASRLGQYEKAQEFLRKAIGMLNAEVEPLHKNWLILALGSMELALGQSTQARTSFTTCLNSYRSHGYDWGIAHSLRFLGKVEHFDGQFDEAQRCYSECLAISRKMDDIAGVSLVLNSIGETHLVSQNFDKAHASLQEALTLSLTGQIISAQQEALKNLGRLMLAWGKQQQASAYLEDGLRLTDKFAPTTLELLLSMAQIGRIPIQIVCNLILQHPAAQAIVKREAAALMTEPLLPLDIEKVERSLQELRKRCLD